MLSTLEDFNDIIVESGEVRENTARIAEYLVNDTVSFCPELIKMSPAMQNKLNTTALIHTIDYFDNLLNPMLDAEESATYAYTRAKKIDEFIDFYASNNWILPSIVALITMCASFFIFCTIFKIMGKNEGILEECILSYFIMPLFITLVIFIWFMILSLGIATFMDSGKFIY